MARPIVVVLGAGHEACEAEISDLAVTCTFNAQWSEGMAGSLRTGLTCLLNLAPETDGVLVQLADQPFVRSDEYSLLIDVWGAHGRQIAAASYGGIVGAPAVFSRLLFDELMSLEGQQGARVLLDRHAANVTPVELPSASLDLDTPQEFAEISKLDANAAPGPDAPLRSARYG